jgi:23S rRNA (guanosine2251-2'-O)-methyltransferase
MSDFDLIVGIHSIADALQNNKRNNVKLFFTDDGKSDFLKKTSVSKSEFENFNYQLVSPHKLQELGKELYKDKDLDFQRVPSQIFMTCDELETYDVNWLYEQVRGRVDLKILCLDQVSDVHNGAAILRTASFYGVDIILIPGKRSFGLTPSFFRIASGAAEHIPMVHVQSLPKVIKKLNSMNTKTIALSEHVENELKSDEQADQNICLILGKEDTGISNAVLRICSHQLSLKPVGKTQSLNVSIAAAIAMEKVLAVKN